MTGTRTSQASHTENVGDANDASDSSDSSQVTLAAPITAVTVFSDGARVTRTGRTELEQGVAPVVAATLPDSADPASVRVAVRGHDLAGPRCSRQSVAE